MSANYLKIKLFIGLRPDPNDAEKVIVSYRDYTYEPDSLGEVTLKEVSEKREVSVLKEHGEEVEREAAALSTMHPDLTKIGARLGLNGMEMVLTLFMASLETTPDNMMN